MFAKMEELPRSGDVEGKGRRSWRDVEGCKQVGKSRRTEANLRGRKKRDDESWD